MKNTIKLLGIIALVAIIGFSMVSCSDDNDDGVGNPALGDTLSLTGQVYTEKWDEWDDEIFRGYSEFSGSISFNTGIGGTGGITNGKLNFSISTPTSLKSDWWWDDDATVSPASTKGVILLL